MYFYAIVGVAACLLFFASPAKAELRRRLNVRAKAAGQATPAAHTPAVEKEKGEVELLVPGQRREDVRGPALGLPDDPGRDLDEIMSEIRQEVEMRKEKGQPVTQGLQEALSQKIEELRQVSGDQKNVVADKMEGVMKDVKAKSG